MHPNLHEPPKGQNVICHIAIPTHDLDAAVSFYEGVLGCPLSRRYDDRVTFDFFDHQLVCHLCPDKIDTSVSMYPRHFGVTFVSAESFDSVFARAKAADCPFFKDMFERFSDLPERHRTYFLVDPSNNLVEFKHYYEPKYIY